MNDSDDEMLSNVVDGFEEDEDWTDTNWAQPVPPSSADTNTSPKSGRQQITLGGPGRSTNENGSGLTQNLENSKKTDSQLKTLKESLADSAKDKSMVNRMSLNDNKAGMEGLDKERINQIIHESSRGSKFFENEQKKEQQMKRRIEEQRMKIDRITEEQLQQGLTEADRLLDEFERYRDLSHTIVHIDMDAFYAAVEMRDDPSLKDKPMAVGGTAMLSTSNYHARKFGVRAAMPGFIGKKLCPDLIIVPANFDKYTSVSKQVRSILADYDPNFCPMSLDEAYLDISDHLDKRQHMSESDRTYLCRDRGFIDSKDHCLCDLNVEEKKMKFLQYVDDREPVLESGEATVSVCDGCGRQLPPFHKVLFGVDDEEAVKEMRTRIEQRTRLTASSGIAPNMMLAKVCSDKNKPNGQYKIPATKEAVLSFIRDLPTRKISGIGKVSETMLNAIGVLTCTDLYEKRALLYHLYSPISFNYFMRICLGIGSTTVERDSERKSMSTERTFSEISKPADLYMKCEELCESLAEDLKEEQLKGKTVSIKLKTVKFEVKTRAHTLADYTADKDEILQAATDLLRTEIQACSPQPLRLRLMGVRMSSLLRESLCKNKKQNTITGLLKKMAEKTVKDCSIGKLSTVDKTTGSNDDVLEVRTLNIKTASVEMPQIIQTVNGSDSVITDSSAVEQDQEIKSLDHHGSANGLVIEGQNSFTGTVERELDTLGDFSNNPDKAMIQYENKIKSDHGTGHHLHEAKDTENGKEDHLAVEISPALGCGNSFKKEVCVNEPYSESHLGDLPVGSKAESCKPMEIDLKNIADEQPDVVSHEAKTESCAINDDAACELDDSSCIINKSVCHATEHLNNKSTSKDESQEPVVYTPGRRTRSRVRNSPQNIRSRKRRNSKQNSKTDMTAYVCPVCCQNMLFKDLNQFNEHIDDCIAERNINNDHFPATNGENATQEQLIHYDENVCRIEGSKCNIQDSTERNEDKNKKSNKERRKKDKPDDNMEDKLDVSSENNLVNTNKEVELVANDKHTIKLKVCANDTEVSENVKLNKAAAGSELCRVISVQPGSSAEQHMSDVGEENNKEFLAKPTQSCNLQADFEQNESVIRDSKIRDCDKTVEGKTESCQEKYFSDAPSNADNEVELSKIIEAEAVSVNEDKMSESNAAEHLIDTRLEMSLHTYENTIGNEFDSENQCDVVSSTNENDYIGTNNEDKTLQSEPCLPFLSPELLQINEENNNSSKGDNCDKIEKENEVQVKTDTSVINDIVVDSTSNDIPIGMPAKITAESEVEKLVENLINKTISLGNEESIEFKFNSCMKRFAVESPSKSDRPGISGSSTDCNKILERPSCSLNETKELKESYMNGDENAIEEETGSLLVCPICNIEQRVADLSAFNDHVDSCLSRGAISEILKEQRQNDSETSKPKRSLTSVSGQKSAKRRKTNLKMPKCKSIASFFQEK